MDIKTENVLEVKDLDIKLDGKTILNRVSFAVRPKEVVAIIGPNGAGKTVLIKTLMGFIKPAGGEYRWKEGIRIGYVPQKFSLERTLPLTVGEFIKLKKGATAALIDDALFLVGLDKSFKERPIGSLSGGEAQRVSVAFSIADKPEVLIFDEPEESIDVVGQESIYNLIHNLSCEKGITVIFVSHDLNIVYGYAGNVICLNRNQVVCAGAPREILSAGSLDKIYGEKVVFHHH